MSYYYSPYRSYYSPYYSSYYPYSSYYSPYYRYRDWSYPYTYRDWDYTPYTPYRSYSYYERPCHTACHSPCYTSCHSCCTPHDDVVVEEEYLTPARKKEQWQRTCIQELQESHILLHRWRQDFFKQAFWS